MNLKITVEGDLVCDREEKTDFMGMLHGNNAFRALSDFRSHLRNKIKHNDNEVEIQVYEKCLEYLNGCLEGENIHGIFYDFFN